MAYTFNKLSDVQEVEHIPEDVKFLFNDNGVIKQGAISGGIKPYIYTFDPLVFYDNEIYYEEDTEIGDAIVDTFMKGGNIYLYSVSSNTDYPRVFRFIRDAGFIVDSYGKQFLCYILGLGENDGISFRITHFPEGFEPNEEELGPAQV